MVKSRVKYNKVLKNVPTYHLSEIKNLFGSKKYMFYPTKYIDWTGYEHTIVNNVLNLSKNPEWRETI